MVRTQFGRFSVGQEVVIDGVRGIVRRAAPTTDADSVRHNPAFDANYESEQGRYLGPLWYPLDGSAPPARPPKNTDER